MYGYIRNRAGARMGFTLIELLVVIAIIAILAAILFPVFTKARDNAKLTRCISHLGQIGRAVQSYCDDNDGRFPIGPAYDYDGSGRVVGLKYTQWLCNTIGGMSPGYLTSGPPPGESWGPANQWLWAGPKERPLYKYTSGSLGIWKCPSERKQHNADTPAQAQSEYPSRYWGTTYVFNGIYVWEGAYPSGGNGDRFYTLMGPTTYFANAKDYPAPRRLTEMKRPSKIWMVGERTLHYYWNLKHTGGNGAPPLGHQEDKPFSPVVYCDGHTGTIRLTSDVLADPNNRWGFIERGWHPNPKWRNEGVY